MQSVTCHSTVFFFSRKFLFHFSENVFNKISANLQILAYWPQFLIPLIHGPLIPLLPNQPGQTDRKPDVGDGDISDENDSVAQIESKSISALNLSPEH